MKYVIDIPTEYYEAIKKIPVETYTADMLIIANGKPLNSVLDEIRAEIAEEYKVESEHPYGQGLRKALQIIDKYKAESEPQESDTEKRKEWPHKPCINYEDGCEEWAGCPCAYYKAESEG